MQSALHALLPEPPQVGSLVRVRSRQYLVEERVEPPQPGHSTLVRMSCLDDDAQGEPLTVLWEHELDAEVVSSSWTQLGARPFDPPNLFAAYLHALRWNCVTATDPKLFQSPFRAGIEVMAYQLEPLRKALLLPRVNLFIADDVGLGKTIEAGLVLRELLMRQKVRKIVVAAPPSVVPQWREELEQRFGLTFVIYDRDFVARMRRERGYGINPFTTHTRFLISHALLRDEEYAAPLRDWLDQRDASTTTHQRAPLAPGSLLILDEAHHAAPATSARYALDSHFTRAIRDLAERFEHRLFLSATPHNGLSNSFSALMEILDPQRFLRGFPIDPKLRDTVMVRRLKSDLRAISGGFPARRVEQIDLDGLPDDAPELLISRLLDQYWSLREQRLSSLSPGARAAQGLILINLQKRLLSSIEAFARTLRAHRRSMTQRVSGSTQPARAESAQQWLSQQDALDAALDPDDERAGLDEGDVEAEEEQTVESATSVARGALQPTEEELALLARMESLAEAHRKKADARVEWLIGWIRRELCPDLPSTGTPSPGKPAAWQPRRVILFTEYADTKRYLEERLRAAIAGSDRAAERIATFHGGMPDDLREEVKRAFNADPAEHPLRILIATDAAREGVNLQNHCADLFHVDLPWNPSRLEQRNGRIDRKLQRAAEVRCHYFIYTQRDSDRVLQVLVQRTATIQKELGSFPPVLEDAVARVLAGGIVPSRRRELADSLAARLQTPRSETIDTELESARARTTALQEQIEELRDILEDSKRSLDLNHDQLRDVLSSSLHLLGEAPLRPLHRADLEIKGGVYEIPALDRRPGADPTWADTMDTLRAPRARDTTLAEWRQQAPIRPVVFQDTGHLDSKVVHLHLEHRLVQRLLGRFLAQGFLLDDLSRGCVGQSADAIPRVLLLGRLSLYGDQATRLHDEIVAIAARLIEPELRSQPLQPYAEDGQQESWKLLLSSLAELRPGPTPVPAEVQQKLLAAAPRDVRELLPHLEARCAELATRATEQLRLRGEREAKEMGAILTGQRTRIVRKLAELKESESSQQLTLAGFSDDERQQYADNARHWESRLTSIAKEIKSEPARILRSYVVCAQRIEPVGLAYLWPVTG